ncbi:mitochondrial 54S ribosomal protein YmL9 [Piedraia hortae CBS 480.64]|uniref:Large ribosomal subunit protein uL3m n=1 Tax=Piedraia hortae CBS 480.64 TaxID=1314780 RepID=A0A6A7C9N8_9PEZI|nr:mitochondrial 54S ribosomal protein YmL9 [Piedraia hortae CBS 480.64]
MPPTPPIRFLLLSSKRSISSISRPNPNFERYNNLPGHAPLRASRAGSLLVKDSNLSLRTGVLAVKKGMTAIYDPVTSVRTPCTVLQLDRCQVVGHKRRSKHGYFAVQVGMGTKEARNVSRAERGHFAKQGVPIKKEVVEFRVKSAEGLPPIGSLISAGVFKEGQFVDVKATSKGKGFAGGMKRWGWAGQPASHGNSLTHRAMGSAGASQGSGSRVHPGKKMAGRMGGEQRTVRNLKVMKVDVDNGIVVLAGCIPGPNKGIIKVQDAFKKSPPEGVDANTGLSSLAKEERAVS